MSSVDQQLAQITISRFRNAQLLVGFSRLILLWDQSQECPRGATRSEAAWILESQDDAGNTVFSLRHSAKHITWSQRVTAGGNWIEIVYDIEGAEALPDEWPGNTQVSLRNLAEGLDSGEFRKPQLFLPGLGVRAVFPAVAGEKHHEADIHLHVSLSA